MADRRWHTPFLRRLFPWLFRERRSGTDRRRRTEEMYDTGRTMHGVPIIIDESVPPGHAEFRSGRRTVDVPITPKEEK